MEKNKLLFIVSTVRKPSAGFGAMFSFHIQNSVDDVTTIGKNSSDNMDGYLSRDELELMLKEVREKCSAVAYHYMRRKIKIPIEVKEVGC